VIADALSGKRIAVTGATGFLGTALVERLLRAVPGCEVAVLVRPGRRQSAAERVRREILRNDSFDRLRADLGDGFDDAMAQRLLVMAGDVSSDGLGLDDDGRALLASCDVSWRGAALPFRSSIHSWVMPLFFSRLVPRTVYTTRLASGDSAGLPTRSMLARSSMVRPRGAAVALAAARSAAPVTSRRRIIRSLRCEWEAGARRPRRA